MGMDAEIFAIGKFGKWVVNYLDYPPEFYADTPEGATIIVLVCGALTTTGSQLLAESFGIDPWKFEQHCNIPVSGIDFTKMSEAVEYPAADLLRVVALYAAGFTFYYRPNG